MSDSKIVGRGAEQYTVRFPDGLRARLKAAAAANGRSINSEIVARLEDSFDLESARNELSEAEIKLTNIVKRERERDRHLDDIANRLKMLEEGLSVLKVSNTLPKERKPGKRKLDLGKP